jgi:hypothetical protein
MLTASLDVSFMSSTLTPLTFNSSLIVSMWTTICEYNVQCTVQQFMPNSKVAKKWAIIAKEG